ncbi:hypothetical protein V500_08415 [Pseudogymnoascus sp. VKM F-4518 (FW-2643)]|nr:hypothetical protein V500_08415 [Pseudogymnoascus sp. VKM F-4518 (FW-2643)]
MHDTTQFRFSEVHAPGSREPAIAIQPASTPAPAPQLAHSPTLDGSRAPTTAQGSVSELQYAVALYSTGQLQTQFEEAAIGNRSTVNQTNMEVFITWGSQMLQHLDESTIAYKVLSLLQSRPGWVPYEDSMAFNS